MPRQKSTAFDDEQVVFDDEDTSHLGSSAVGSSAQRQRGSVQYTQDIRIRARSQSSRSSSRSTSMQRQELEEEGVPNGEILPPPRSRPRQAASHGRMGKVRGGKYDEEKNEEFTGFDELDAIAAAKPQEETSTSKERSKGHSSPTITRSTTALPRKKRSKEGVVAEAGASVTVETTVAVEDLPFGHEESLPQGGDKRRRQECDYQILAQQEYAIETEPVPKPKRPKSKATVRKASKNQSVPLSSGSDLGRPAHWGGIASAAPGGTAKGKKAGKARVQHHSPPPKAARPYATASSPSASEATARDKDKEGPLNVANPSFRQRWGRRAPRGEGKQEYLNTQQPFGPRREDIEEAGDLNGGIGPGLSPPGNTAGGGGNPHAPSLSQPLNMSAQKPISSFSVQSSGDQPSDPGYAGDGRSSPPHAHAWPRNRGSSWGGGIAPLSVQRKRLERLHKAMKNNQTMFALRAHDQAKGVDLANPRNRARVSVSVLMLRREPWVVYPLVGFLVYVIPEGVKINKHHQEKKEATDTSEGGAGATAEEKDKDKEKEGDAVPEAVPHVTRPTTALEGTFAYALFRENRSGGGGGGSGSSSSSSRSRVAQTPVERSLCTIYDPLVTWTPVAADNYGCGCQDWRGLPDLPLQPAGMLWGTKEPLRFPVLINTHLTDCQLPADREDMEVAIGGAKCLAGVEKRAAHWPQL